MGKQARKPNVSVGRPQEAWVRQCGMRPEKQTGAEYRGLTRKEGWEPSLWIRTQEVTDNILTLMCLISWFSKNSMFKNIKWVMKGTALNSRSLVRKLLR